MGRLYGKGTVDQTDGLPFEEVYNKEPDVADNWGVKITISTDGPVLFPP